ncbi:MAG: hypothetical protein V3S30_10460 [Thermoanaerobaculia bacterium]
MTRKSALFLSGILILFLLHHDLWLWWSPRLVLGLPVGLTYHIAYCFAAAGLMAWMVFNKWPNDLTGPSDPVDD